MIGLAAVCMGSADRLLGRLAALLGREREAERHFEQALKANARLRAPVCLAHTQLDYATALGPGAKAHAVDRRRRRDSEELALPRVSPTAPHACAPAEGRCRARPLASGATLPELMSERHSRHRREAIRRARPHARAARGFTKHEGYLEGPEHIVTWAVGHLVQLADPDEYDERFKKWRMADLPIVPDRFKLVVRDERSKKQMNVVKRLLGCDEVRVGRQRLRRRARG